MEPVTGKIVYDETHTVRVSSPIFGRVTGAIAAVGALFAPVGCSLNWIVPNWGRPSLLMRTLWPTNLAERTYQRIKELSDNGITPRKELDQAEDNLSRAARNGTSAP